MAGSLHRDTTCSAVTAARLHLLQQSWHAAVARAKDQELHAATGRFPTRTTSVLCTFPESDLNKGMAGEVTSSASMKPAVAHGVNDFSSPPENP